MPGPREPLPNYTYEAVDSEKTAIVTSGRGRLVFQLPPGSVALVQPFDTTPLFSKIAQTGGEPGIFIFFCLFSLTNSSTLNLGYCAPYNSHFLPSW